MPPFQSQASLELGMKANPYQQSQSAGPNAEVPACMPNMQQPNTIPFRPSGRKRALLVGCNYRQADPVCNLSSGAGSGCCCVRDGHGGL